MIRKGHVTPPLVAAHPPSLSLVEHVQPGVQCLLCAAVGRPGGARCNVVTRRYIHLPGSLDVATRVEAKRKEVAAAHKVHALQQGRQPALAKGSLAFPARADWELGAEQGDEELLEGE